MSDDYDEELLADMIEAKNQSGQYQVTVFVDEADGISLFVHSTPRIGESIELNGRLLRVTDVRYRAAKITAMHNPISTIAVFAKDVGSLE